MTEQGTHFWLITLQTRTAMFTCHGSATPGDDDTRQTFYEQIRDAVAAGNGLTNYHVLHFQLELNQL